jgi:hypothetical protein
MERPPHKFSWAMRQAVPRRLKFQEKFNTNPPRGQPSPASGGKGLPKIHSFFLSSAARSGGTRGGRRAAFPDPRHFFRMQPRFSRAFSGPSVTFFFFCAILKK